MTVDNKHILILTADAGMGHRSAAEAIRYAIEQKSNDRCTTTIENPLDHPKVPDLFRRSQTDYDEIVKKLPELYEFGFKASNAALPTTFMEAGFIIALYEAINDLIRKQEPDLIVTTYPVYQAPVHAVSVIKKLHVPLITVVTDLVSVHKVWFHTGATRCTVPTEIVKQKAIKAGLAPEKIILTGIPIHPRIQDYKQVEKQALRKTLGWAQDKINVLIVGSPRIENLLDTIKLIDNSGYDLHLAVVAGGNEALFKSLQEVDWYHSVTLYNFVDFLPKLMRAADLIVCKAGGLIVTESLASGLPLMLVHALPGQEIGNAAYVVENQAGKMCVTPAEILDTLSHWLRNDHILLDETAQNAANLIPFDAASTIADLVWDILCEPTKLTKEKDSSSLQELLKRFNISS